MSAAVSAVCAVLLAAADSPLLAAGTAAVVRLRTAALNAGWLRFRYVGLMRFRDDFVMKRHRCVGLMRFRDDVVMKRHRLNVEYDLDP